MRLSMREMFEGQSRAQDKPPNLRGAIEDVYIVENVHKDIVFTVEDLLTIGTSGHWSGPEI
jgi:hypothetical protein